MIPEVDERRVELDEICRRYGVLRLDLFGSAASGQFREESDLDFLVEFEHPRGPGYADRYFGLVESLRTLFGRDVDVIVESAIANPYFRESVTRSKVPLYAA